MKDHSYEIQRKEGTSYHEGLLMKNDLTWRPTLTTPQIIQSTRTKRRGRCWLSKIMFVTSEGTK